LGIFFMIKRRQVTGMTGCWWCTQEEDEQRSRENVSRLHELDVIAGSSSRGSFLLLNFSFWCSMSFIWTNQGNNMNKWKSWITEIFKCSLLFSSTHSYKNQVPEKNCWAKTLSAIP
jgi:hypothetical protein